MQQTGQQKLNLLLRIVGQSLRFLTKNQILAVVNGSGGIRSRTRMNRIRTNRFRSKNNLFDFEIFASITNLLEGSVRGDGGRRWTNANGLVSEINRRSVCICFGINESSVDTQAAAGAKETRGYLASICNQKLSDRLLLKDHFILILVNNVGCSLVNVVGVLRPPHQNEYDTCGCLTRAGKGRIENSLHSLHIFLFISLQF